MSILKQIARKVVFPAVVSTGTEKLFSSAAQHNKLILVYHGVVEKPDHSISLGPIEVKQFRKHLEYFKQNFDVVSQDTIFQMYRDEYKPKRKTLALTFDDGYENNYNRVAPLLKEFNYNATIYVIGNSIENPEAIAWYDHLFFIKKKLNYSKIDTSVVNEPSVSSEYELVRLIQKLDLAKRHILFAELDKQVKLKDVIHDYPREHWKLMTAEQNRQLAADGLIEIAAHSYSHPNLGEISVEAAQEELTKSRMLIENAIQKPVVAVAYPDGSYTDEVKKASIAAGYKNLLAANYRCASDVNDKSVLPRYCISSTTTYESNIVAINRAFNSYGF